MGILEFHKGCHDNPGCWGPSEDFYTLFGTELRLLTIPIIVSLILGFITFGILYFFKKKGKLNFPLYLIIIISVIVAIIFLGLLAPMFQVIY